MQRSIYGVVQLVGHSAVNSGVPAVPYVPPPVVLQHRTSDQTNVSNHHDSAFTSVVTADPPADFPAYDVSG